MIKTLFRILQSKGMRHLCLSFVIVVLVGVFLPEKSFAQGIISEAQKDMYNGLAMVVDMLSWLWIVPATLAGKLMSNTMAYGKPFFLDRYLFQMWQLMRTFSLFALGFIMVGGIIKNFFTLGEPKKYFEIIKKTLIAGLLISLSWFVLAALIDFSIIATSAVSGIPLKVMETEFRRMEGKIHCFDTVTVKKFGSQDQLDIARDDNTNYLTLEQIMPAGDSISGPLVFLGCGILNLSDSTRLPEGTVTTDLLLQQGLKLLISMMIVLPMIILMVTNMMRIFFIWLWAMFAPIIALDLVWGGPLTKDGSSVQKYFSPKNILGLIFQPVAVVACMSIGIILILGIYDAQIGGDRYQQESMEKTFSVFPLGNDKIQVGTGALNGAYINGTVLEKSGNWIGGAVGELIMVLFCIVILWSLIKVGFSASEITKGVSDGMYKFGSQMAKTVPFIPTSFGGMSIGALEQGAGQVSRNISNTFQGKQAVQADKLSKLMGMSAGEELTSVEMNSIRGASTENNKQLMLNKIKTIQEEKPITVNSDLTSALQTWLKTGRGGNGGLQHIRNTGGSRFRSLEVNSSDFNNDNIANVWTGDSANYKLVRQYFDTFLRNGQVNDSVTLGSEGQLQSRYNSRGS